MVPKGPSEIPHKLPNLCALGFRAFWQPLRQAGRRADDGAGVLAMARAIWRVGRRPKAGVDLVARLVCQREGGTKTKAADEGLLSSERACAPADGKMIK